MKALNGLPLVLVLIVLSLSQGVAAVEASPSHASTKETPASTFPVTLVSNRSGNQVDVNMQIKFIATPSGGTPPYTYAWGTGGFTCTPSTGSEDNCTAPNRQLAAPVSVNVTDKIGNYGTTYITVIVSDDPVVTAPSTDPSQSWFDERPLTPVRINSSLSYGEYGGTWHWSAPTQLNCTANASYISCSPTATGNYTVGVSYTDPVGVTSPTVTTTFRVYPHFTIGTLVPSKSWLEVGQSVVFSVPLYGGNTSASDNIDSGGEAGMACSLGPHTINCVTKLAGYDSVQEVVCNGMLFLSNNGDSDCAPSNTTYVYVNPNPTVQLQPSMNVTPVGSRVNLSASATGGTGIYSYTYLGLPNGCTTANQSTLPCIPTKTGNYSLRVTVTDTAGFNVSASANLTVYYHSPLVASVPSADVDQSVTFTTTAINGTTGDTATWTTPAGLGCPHSPALTIQCIPTQAGHYTISATVTDSSGDTVTASTTYTVFSDPSVSVTTSRPSVDIGQTVTFSAYPANGTGHYLRFNWNTTKGSGIWGWLNCTPTTGSTLNCTAAGAGYVSVTVNVTDTNGGVSVSTQMLYFVDVDAYAPSLSCSPTTAPVADWVTCSAALNASIKDGAYPYTLDWTNSNEINCTVVGSNPNGTVEYYRCLTEDVGVASVSVTATDTNGWTSHAAATSITVTMELSLSATAGNQSANENGTLNDTGAEVAFQAYFQGGTAPWTCELTENNTGTALAVTQTASGQCSLAYVWPHGGTYVATVTVKDGVGNKISGWILVDASPPGPHPPGGVILHSLLAQAGSYGAHQNGTLEDDGIRVSFFAYFDGGTGPYTCTLTQNNSNGDLSNSQSAAAQCSVNYTWPHGGTYVATLTVTDSAGTHSSAWILVDAAGPSAGLTNSVVLEAIGAQAGSNAASRNGTLQDNNSGVTFTATFRNGTGPYTCMLTQNGSSTALTSAQSSGASCSLTYTWTHGGTYVTTVTVTDSAGSRSSGWVVMDVTVGPQANGNGSKSSIWPSWWWAAVLVVVLAVVVTVLWVAKRSRPPPTIDKGESPKDDPDPTELPDWPGQ